ncbi:RNase adapter RapZ [Spartinivicinus ruber]|uniref:RNase adapter RapZ n=1 Tax=Spartinivicinus ruber TaxID=2683272 RepID=UPI0013D0C3C2|nr:RNase adapter RapZ [Spartinivicinus ruber]
MKLIIISGRSGSGKSTGLHVLEDQGYYCIDNMPAGLLPAFVEEMKKEPLYDKAAVSIDARNVSQDLRRFPAIMNALKEQQIDAETIYLDAEHATLLKRFSETRRKHPLSSQQRSLDEAIKQEKEVLEPIAKMADLTIDTSQLSLHELRDIISKRVARKQHSSIALLFQSFGFKKGIPIDADYVFDVRCLPNPYWVTHLRQYSGLEEPVKEFLGSQQQVLDMFDDIKRFVEHWLPCFEANNRSYITIAIGCTGGHHRSVYISEKLAIYFREKWPNVQVRHRELP